MHLVGPYMTTTNYKKRKQKGLTKRDKQAQLDHDKWLRKMNAHPEQVAKNKEQRVSRPIHHIPDYRSSGNTIPTSDVIPGGSTAPKETLKYTGDYIKGIGTMHKSNMVPISSKEDAIEIARMRRG